MQELLQDTTVVDLDGPLQQLRSVETGFSRTVDTLIRAVELKDRETCQHLYRATIIANACLEQIDPNLARRPETNFGFLLHDVGKIGIPDSILCKEGPLADREWDTMRTHPELGAAIVQPAGFPTCVTDVILYHHERWDGLGYPYRLQREEIPLTARVFALADSYDAMTSDRPYRAAMDVEDALEIIASGAGVRYDPEITQVFVDLIRR